MMTTPTHYPPTGWESLFRTHLWDDLAHRAPTKEAEALIRKALERSEEHEAEKKARMRKAPLSPNERDW